MKRTLYLLALLFTTSISSLAQDATALYDEGVKLKQAGNTGEAIAKFRKAVELRPDYTDALYEIGWCLNDQKDYAGAIKVLRKVVPVWTNVPRCHFELAYAFDNSGQKDSAMYYYNKTLELKPDYSGVYKQLGYIAYNNDDYKTTLANFDKYESYAKNPITDYLYWYRKGFTLNATKDYAAAVTALQKSLEFKTTYTNTYLELGYAHTKLKQNDEAIEWFNKAMELDPKSHIPYNGIAEVYRDNVKDMTQAMNWYQKALALNSTERKANFGMGYCSNSLGKYEDAIGYLKKAIQMENTYTAAYVELGYSYYMTGSNSDALTNLDKAISLNPKNENAHYYKGLVYISQKDKYNAQRMVDALQALNSKLATTMRDKVSKM